jgi:hypothetical protein
MPQGAAPNPQADSDIETLITDGALIEQDPTDKSPRT